MNAVARILFVTDASSSAWTGICLLAGALPLERFRATIAAVGPAPSAAARSELMQLAPHATLTLLDGALETERDPWQGVEEVRSKLLLFCERTRPDLIHATQLCLGKLAWTGPRVLTATHDLLAWGRAVQRTPACDLARYRSEVKAGLETASVVAAPSAFLARELERHHELKDAVRVIRHGTQAAPRGGTERGLLGVACGDLDDSSERLDLLASIAPKLPGPIGIAGEARSLPKPLVALGKPSRKELLALMAGARIFVSLSRYDPLGVHVLDAQAAGARLVLLDTAPNRELWSGAADLVHDAESLAGAIRRAAAAPRLKRPEIPRYAIASTAAAYVRLYEEVLSIPGQLAA
jgi:hypothetical protein